MKQKSKLQRSAFYFSAFSIICAITCAVFLFLKIDKLGWESPVIASLLASIFFFGFVSFLLVIIGSTDIPNLKVGSDSD